MNGKKIYFASDMHLGAPYISDPRKHEARIVAWLDTVKKNAHEIYLIGDIFDFWYEYKHSVPRGFTRFLGKLSEITDSGIPVHVFTGNHDVWIFDYLPSECGVILHQHPLKTEIAGKVFYLAHGDELGAINRSYMMVKRLFRNRTAQWFFSLLHPDIAVSFAKWWSGKSRIKNEQSYKSTYMGDDKEWQVRYARKVLNDNPEINYFLFGHRHIAREIPLNDNCTVFYLGDWLNNFSYAEFDGTDVKLKFFKDF